MLCNNGHNNIDSSQFCTVCGSNQFQPGSTFPAAAPQNSMTPRTTNGMAIASMVLGIVWVYWVGSILALVFGYVARKQIKENNQNGDGMAIAGIVLGWVGLAFLLLYILLGVILVTNVHGCFNSNGLC